MSNEADGVTGGGDRGVPSSQQACLRQQQK